MRNKFSIRKYKENECFIWKIRENSSEEGSKMIENAVIVTEKGKYYFCIKVINSLDIMNTKRINIEDMPQYSFTRISPSEAERIIDEQNRILMKEMNRTIEKLGVLHAIKALSKTVAQKK